MSQTFCRALLTTSVLCLSTVLVSVCAQEPVSVAPRIVDGKSVPASTFPTVGIIQDAARTFSCTGTLIDPTHVLTAGHCAVDEGTGQPLAGDAGRFTLGGTTYKTARIFLHPSFSSNLIGTDGVFDVAIFQLENPVNGVTPSPINRNPPTVGTTVTLAGYGLTGTSKTGRLTKQPPPGVIVTGTNTIESITQSELVWTFTPGTSSNAPGDSGGPAFIDVNGTPMIAGITSLGETIGGNKIKFGAKNFDTRIDTIAPWIDRVLTGTSNDVPPMFISPITATPNPATVGDNVQFSTAATDPDDTNLFYVWDFGDGTSASGPTVAHNYVFPGTYAVSVTVSDIVTGVTSNANVVVSPQSTGVMNVDKLQIGVSFMALGRDSALLQATLQPLSSVTQLPTVGVLSLGDAQIAFSLDQRGKGKAGKSTFQLNTQKGTFTANIHNTDLASGLMSAGIVNATVVNAPVTVPVNLILNGVAFSDQKMLLYTAKADKGGRAK